MPTKLFYKTKRSYTPDKGQVFTEPSLTVQGETYSMKELIERYKLGQHIAQNVPVYFDVNELDEINRFRRTDLDLTDLDEFGRHVDQLQQAYDNALAKQKAEASKTPENPPQSTETPKDEV